MKAGSLNNVQRPQRLIHRNWKQGTVHVFKLATAEAKAAAARQLASPGHGDGNSNPKSSLKFVSVSLFSCNRFCY